MAYQVPISEETIRATDLRQIKTSDDEFGLMTYDPAYMNTASCRSAVTYLDGDNGVLRYRGYPIEQLADKSDFLRGRAAAAGRRAAVQGRAGRVGEGRRRGDARRRTTSRS